MKAGEDMKEQLFEGYDDNVRQMIKKYSLKYNLGEMKEIISELNLEEDELSVEKLLSKTSERKDDSKFCILYHDLKNYNQTNLDKSLKYLSEVKRYLQEMNKLDLAVNLDWVISKIRNEEIYAIDYVSLNLHSSKSEGDNDFESKNKLIEEYSTCNFNQKKIEIIKTAKENVIKRHSLQIISPQRSMDGLRKSIYSISNNYIQKGITNKKLKDILYSNDLKEKYKNVINESEENENISRLRSKGSLESESNSSDDEYKINNEKDELYDDAYFDIFEHCENDNRFGSEYVLNEISFYMFEKYALFCIVNYRRFDMFLNKIKVGYDNMIPYHTHIHAADVLQTCNVYSIFSNLKEELELNELDITGFFISAIIHDYKHPGLTNSYHINKRSDIAIKYNDISVLENFHVSMAFKVISENNSNIFCDLTIEEFKVVRKRIIECVLSTDMARHTKAVNCMKLKIKAVNDDKNIMKNIINVKEDSKFDRQQEILNYFLHCADISNPSKNEKLCKRWTILVVEEFHLQGDLEKKENLPISFLCDRNNFNLPKSQIGFISNIVFPCFTLLVMLCPNLEFVIKSLDSNLKMWVREDEKNIKKKEFNQVKEKMNTLMELKEANGKEIIEKEHNNN